MENVLTSIQVYETSNHTATRRKLQSLTFRSGMPSSSLVPIAIQFSDKCERLNRD